MGLNLLGMARASKDWRHRKRDGLSRGTGLPGQGGGALEDQQTDLDLCRQESCNKTQKGRHHFGKKVLGRNSISQRDLEEKERHIDIRIGELWKAGAQILNDARNSCSPVHCPLYAERWAGNSPPVCQVKSVCVWVGVVCV